jgi:hypothetical protein
MGSDTVLILVSYGYKGSQYSAWVLINISAYRHTICTSLPDLIAVMIQNADVLLTHANIIDLRENIDQTVALDFAISLRRSSNMRQENRLTMVQVRRKYEIKRRAWTSYGPFVYMRMLKSSIFHLGSNK